MSINVPDSKQQLWSEGSEIKATLDRTTTTSATISWNLPSTINVYDGALVLLHTQEMTPDNYPIDQTRYTASADLNIPADNINGALVVGALYGDKITSSINLINLVPNEIYYVSIHALTNTLEYYTTGSFSYVTETKTDAYSGDIPTSNTPPLSPTLGQVFYSPSTGEVSMWNGSSWQVVQSKNVASGSVLPDISTVTLGAFFWHTGTQNLYSFDGLQWNLTNTENQGIPLYNKYGVGDDGTNDEIAELADTLKRDLGWPQTCVELNNIDFTKAIDKSIKEFRRRADNAYTRKYLFLQLKKNRGIYYLNDPALGSNKVVDVIKIHRVNSLAILSLGNNGIYAQQFINQFISPTAVDLVTVHLYSQMSEIISHIFAGEIEYTFHESSRELEIFRRVYSDEKVLIETVMEKTKQEIITDRYAGPWIEDWAKAECMFKLGMVRGKFQSLPGPGGVSLNGAELLTQAQTDFEELRRQISDWEAGGASSEFGNHSILLG